MTFNLEEVNCSSQPSTSVATLWLGKCDVELVYLKGKDNIIAETLSSSHPVKTRTNTDKDCFDAILVHHIPTEVLATEFWLERVRVVMQSWPSTHSSKTPSIPGMARSNEWSVLESIHSFWTYRDKLLSRRWINLQSPTNYWFHHPRRRNSWEAYTLVIWGRRRHILKSLRLCIYWPGIIERHQRIHQEMWNLPVTKAQPAERACHPTWHTEWTMGEGWDWHFPILVLWLITCWTVDYFNKFPLVRVLNNWAAAHVIEILKTMSSWAWHTGISLYRPRETVYISRILRICKVLKVWNSPLNTKDTHSQMGSFKSMVKVVKQIIE